MSKTVKTKSKITNLGSEVMEKIITQKVKMKPRWRFVAGSVAMIISLISLSIIAVFIINLTFFFLRRQAGMGQHRLELMLATFPWWILPLVLISATVGILILRKYDFSYKNNFILIIVGFVASVILAGLILDYSGLNEIWAKKGPMKPFYQQLENRSDVYQKAKGFQQGQVKGRYHYR